MDEKDSLLYYSPETDMPQDIAKKLIFTHPRVTQILSSFGERGHIIKQQDKQDVRRMHIFLTDQGACTCSSSNSTALRRSVPH